MRIFHVLLIGCFFVFASCEYGLPEREGPPPGEKVNRAGQGSSGTGGTKADGGAGQSGGGDDSGAQDTGQDGTGNESDCPNGIRCTAPFGDFICTDPDTYLPPTCAEDADCGFGSCTEYAGQKYCVQECGPAPISKCPPASVCNTIFDGSNVCAQSIVWSAPPCQTQDDCPFGDCLLSYYGQHFCIQPCESTVVENCPGETACVPLEGKYFCADTSTGIPATCTTDGDCDYGVCVPYYDAGYCTQECIPQVVETCPDQLLCRTISTLPLGLFCADDSTLLPPVCDTQEDCDFGTCVAYAGQGYCAEYCSQPDAEILGTVFGLAEDGAAIEGVDGVEVCVFRGDAPDAETCTETNESGQYALVRLDSDVPYYFISMTKEGYQSTLQLAYANQFASTLMFTEQEMGATASDLDFDYPVDNTGQIVFMAFGTESVEGYTVEMTPDEGDGPYYADENSLPDASLEEASISGWGGYFNVPEGTYFLDYTGAGDMVCGDIPAVAVVSGYLTYVLSYCNPL